MFCVICCRLAAPDVWAAGEPIRMADGSVPPRVDLNRANRGFVTFDQIMPLAKPTIRELANPQQFAKDAEPLGFIAKRFAVLATEKDGDSEFLLLGDTKSGKPVGWIEKEFFLARTRCLSDPQTTIPEKAMIRSPENILEQEAKGASVQAFAAIYHAPDTAAKQQKQFSWFSYHFVYDRFSGENGSYVLIGSGDSFSPTDKVADVRRKIHGWVRQEEICEWKTREAFWWNHDNANKRPPGNVWRFKRDSRAQAKVGAAQQEKNPAGPPPLFREMKVAGQQDTAPPQWKSRFPKLDDEFDPRKRSFLYKIGWVAQRGQDRENLQQIQSDLIALQQDLQQIDVLFVIDDTLSMRRWFTVTNDIVDAIKEDLKKQDVRVRIAISYFNDKNRDTGKHEPEKNRLEPINGVSLNRQLRQLRQHEEQDGVNADPHEMMFHGTRQAIETAGFDRQSLKLVIVIGTHPDKSILQDESIREMEIADLAASLKPEWNRPIEFYAIQVEPQTNADLEQFGPQMEAVLGAFHQQREKEIDGAAPIGGWINSQDKDQVKKMVLARFNALREKNRFDQEQLIQAIRGNWDTVFTDDLKRELQDQGIDPKQLKQTSIDFYECWVWEKNQQGEQQIRPWILMKEAELIAIRDFVQAIVQGTRGRKVDDLGELVTGLVQVLVGAEIDPDEPISDVLKKRLGIIVTSPFLRKKPSQMVQISKDDFRQLQVKLQRMNQLLQREEYYKIPESPLNWFWVDVEEQLP